MSPELLQLIPALWCEQLVTRCLEEDGTGHGDITSVSIVDANTSSSFEVNARRHGIVSGLHVLTQAMHLFGDVVLHPICSDGDQVQGLIAVLEGNLRSVLTAERTILNILGGVRSSCTYVGAPSLKQLSKCTTFVRVSNQYNDTFVE